MFMESGEIILRSPSSTETEHVFCPEVPDSLWPAVVGLQFSMNSEGGIDGQGNYFGKVITNRCFIIVSTPISLNYQ